jgi:hypothetical protein
MISPETIATLTSASLVALRNARTGRIEGVSYTAEGLKWLVDKVGNSLFYDKTTKKVIEYETHLVLGKRVDKPVRISYYGSFKRNPLYEIVAYNPVNHISSAGTIINSLQSAEVFFVARAFGLIKNMNGRLEYLDDFKNTKLPIDDSIIIDDDAIIVSSTQ